MDSNLIPPDAGAGAGGDEGAKPSSSEYVTISREELDALRARAGSVAPPGHAAAHPLPAAPPEDEARRHEPPARGREALMDRELAARDQRLGELEQSCKAAVRDRELATALAGKPLVTGAAVQLIKLWRDELDVYEEGGSYKVAARDGRAVAQVVGEWLASSEYSHFCLPTSRGGTGARDANRPAGGAAPPAGPRNLGESVVMKWREEAAARPSHLLKPIGLRRHR